MFATEGGGGREAGILSSCERFHSPLLNNCSEFSQLGLRGVSTPLPSPPSYGAKREDNPPGLSGYFEREGREGRKISFSSFFFSLEKKMEKDSSPSLSRRDRIGLFKGALSIPTSNRLVSPLVGEGLQGGEHCGD